MFQIDPILWLQSFESPGLTWLMSSVSLLGYTPVYIALLITISLGLKLRKGISILLALLIAGILTDGMKRGIQFPRPSDVDIRVAEPGHIPSLKLLENGGGKSFWALPTSEALEAVKAQPEWSYGFPSGHVAAATAFFIGLAFFFRSKRTFIFSAIWVLLMALSRMYLGRHFIADVLAGVGVGLIAVGLAAYILRPLNNPKNRSLNTRTLLPLVAFVVPLVLLVPFIDLLDGEIVGRLLGLLVSYLFIFKIGLFSDAGKVWERISRILIAAFMYIIINGCIGWIMDSTGWEDMRLAEMMATFLITCITFIGAILICKKFRLYTFNENRLITESG